MLNPIIIKEIINAIFPFNPPFFYSGFSLLSPYPWSIINCWSNVKDEIIINDNAIIPEFIKNVLALNFNFSLVLYLYFIKNYNYFFFKKKKNTYNVNCPKTHH